MSVAFVYNIERGTGKDVFFGRQETYTAPACSPGDEQVSCEDVTRQDCRNYTRIFGCCDAVDGGACGISVGCTHCETVSTGQKTCTCKKVQPAAPEVAPPPGQLLPIGTAGATVTQEEGGGGRRINVQALVILGVVAVVGYFLYQRFAGG